MAPSSSAERHQALTEWVERGPAMLRVDEAPDWLVPLTVALSAARPEELSTNDPPARDVADRQAAVLILLGGHGPDSAEVVLTQRASGLRDHPGEVAFPGGGWEFGDTSPVDTALREAWEETGVDAAGVTPLLLLPRLFIRPSAFDVTGVIGYWHSPSPVAPTDPAETSQVFSANLRELARPDRWRDYSVDGWHGPSTRLANDALLWGYTAEVLAFISRNI
jgi:8-oxo-dGTP pyrophosphatase MutT (NUDIX family)